VSPSDLPADSKCLWNVAQISPDYIAQRPWRQYSNSPAWQLGILLVSSAKWKVLQWNWTKQTNVNHSCRSTQRTVLSIAVFCSSSLINPHKPSLHVNSQLHRNKVTSSCDTTDSENRRSSVLIGFICPFGIIRYDRHVETCRMFQINWSWRDEW
jgi:hypothetical protein